VNDEQARWLRVLRVELGCSFGRVAELAHYAEPRFFPKSGALSGRNWCEAAAELLGETPEGWEAAVAGGQAGGQDSATDHQSPAKEA
jgi:hypothetical protein